MKDEEMAEKYKRSHWSDNVTEMNNQYSFQKVKGAPHFYDNAIKQAFLAGLKAGRPQWHDLRKDKNDLPPRMGLGSEEVYVQYDTKGVTDFACYRFDKNIWERSEDDEQAVGVIAWCEIPTFDKE